MNGPIPSPGSKEGATGEDLRTDSSPSTAARAWPATLVPVASANRPGLNSLEPRVTTIVESSRPAATLEALPPPPPGRTGWPWTEAPTGDTPVLPSGKAWPRVTVVTPSFNQADFLEATLRSVILQGYPDLEYIVMDGGSTDGSVEIIRKYAPWISHWRSAPDRGQSDAINQGFALATGSVLAWLNSDDIYLPGALTTAVKHLVEADADIYIGAMDKVYVDGDHSELVKRSFSTRGEPFQEFPIFADGRVHRFHFIQPPSVWTRRIWEATGGLDESYHYQMDREWVNRALAAGGVLVTSDDVLARFTLHPGSKSNDFVVRFLRDEIRLYLRSSVKPGFRFVPCLLSTLRPAYKLLLLRGREAASKPNRTAAFVHGIAARAVKVAWRIALAAGGVERRRLPET